MFVRSWRAILGVAGVAILVSGSLLYARQQPAGSVTTAKFFVVNKTPLESVPVMLATVDPRFPALTVSVAGLTEVSLNDRTISRLTEPVRLSWEYTQQIVAEGTDPLPRLNSAGREGWELVGTIAATRSTIYTLKRALR